ncbi:DUF305 domain-containing protein [Arthrobacter burdickii]|uniref:DUF305 domain-containing protein n=1 Tax=Arthrobacter burdickii TaxID=3035920 RepID=A0ABT8JZV2_9MICC|nr:DUF305 domain-containing protein [Arthrobacter burdickii]MDN4610701.1 DUF305 domain-containing protein [Arthrobacter burdickii]
MKRSFPLSALTLVTALALAACGSPGSGDTHTGHTSGASAPTSGADAATSGADAATSGADAPPEEHNDADVMFAQMMIPHHRQAVEMSDMMLSKDGISTEVLDLATAIRDAQGPEIGTMTGWLEAWGEPLEAGGSMEGHDMGSDSGSDSASGSMDGMMSEDQMSELDAAEGDEASRLFLESMTAHHEGAIGMAQDEIDNGQDPEALRLAETIAETQQAEIDQMAGLLEHL